MRFISAVPALSVSGGISGTALQPTQTLPTQSEEEMGALYAQIPPKSGAFDVVSGNIGYVVEGPAGQIIKVTRAVASTEPLMLATARGTDSGWQVSQSFALLIEKDASQPSEERGLGSLKSLVNPFAKKEDYALFGLSSG
jgi:hypothetical protein